MNFTRIQNFNGFLISNHTEKPSVSTVCVFLLKIRRKTQKLLTKFKVKLLNFQNISYPSQI
jgi:hypothetical protein